MKWLVIISSFVIAGLLWAVEPDEMLDDPELEARARAISSELRCVVCQSENIDASSASVARELRILLREKLTEGMEDEEVKEYLTARYGDFILLRPRFSGNGVALWLFGPIIFLIGLCGAIIFIRKSAKLPDNDLTEDDDHDEIY